MGHAPWEMLVPELKAEISMTQARLAKATDAAWRKRQAARLVTLRDELARREVNR